MAAPMVAAAARAGAPPQPGPARRRDRAPAQGDRAPPGRRGWTPDLGWGILDAGAALTRARDASTAARRRSRVRRAAARARAQARDHLRWSGSDRRRAGVRASGVARYELWRSTDGAPRQAPVLDARRTARRGHAAPRRAATRFYTRRRRPRRQPRAAPPRPADARASRAGARPARRLGASARSRAALARERQQLGQRRLDALGDRVDVGQRVVVAEQAEVHPAVVGHDRDRPARGPWAGRRPGRRRASRARARRAGTAGPGTLVTIRLNRRVEKFSREAWARIVGGAKFCTLASTSAPTACLDSFRPSIAGA